jgi:uncharacterized coiled-coil protein SlyX
MAGTGDDPTPHRLTRLEEHAAFLERTVEQLGEEIAEVNRRVRALAQRLDSLETRIGRLNSTPPEN